MILDSAYNVSFSNGLPPEIDEAPTRPFERLPPYIEDIVRRIVGSWKNDPVHRRTSASVVLPHMVIHVFPLRGSSIAHVALAFDLSRVRYDDC